MKTVKCFIVLDIVTLAAQSVHARSVDGYSICGILIKNIQIREMKIQIDIDLFGLKKLLLLGMIDMRSYAKSGDFA
jgi:hypothetical protein